MGTPMFNVVPQGPSATDRKARDAQCHRVLLLSSTFLFDHSPDILSICWTHH